MAMTVTKENGKAIVINDCRGLTGGDLYKSIVDTTEYIIDQKRKLYCIADFSDTVVSAEVMAYLKSEDSKEAAKYIIIQAVVGITGIKKIFLQAYNAVVRSDTKVFDTIEKAKEYIRNN